MLKIEVSNGSSDCKIKTKIQEAERLTGQARIKREPTATRGAKKKKEPELGNTGQSKALAGV